MYILPQCPLGLYTLVCCSQAAGHLSYIKKSFRTEYIAKLKEKSKNTTGYPEETEEPVGEVDIGGLFEFHDLISQLTEQQQKIALLRYYYGYTDTEIAGKFGISGQAINQIKNRAQKLLKGQLTKQE